MNIEKSLQFNRLWNVKYKQTFDLLLKKVQKRINLSWQGSQEGDDLSTYKTDFMSAANYFKFERNSELQLVLPKSILIGIYAGIAKTDNEKGSNRVRKSQS